MAFTTIPAAGAKLRASVLSALVTEVRPITARKTANETLNAVAVAQNDDELFVSVDASCVYRLETRLSFVSGITPDLKINWTYPVGTTIRWAGTDDDLAGAVRITGNLIETAIPAIGGSGTDLTAFYTGVVITGVNAGTLQLQWAQNTSNASNTIIYAGSYLSLTRIA